MSADIYDLLKIAAEELIAQNTQLKSERDEANEEFHKQIVLYDQLFDEAEKIRIERDEAREALRAVLELANDIPDESLDDWKIEFHKVLEEAK